MFYNFQAQKGALLQCLNIPDGQQPNRGIKKHWNPKFKWLRTKKVIKVDLPNFHEKEDEIPEEEQKKRLKERGLMPARPWSEKPFTLAAVSNSNHFISFENCFENISSIDDANL